MENTVDTATTNQPSPQDNRRQIDTAFDVLSHSYRRTIVASLHDQESEMFEAELIDDILKASSPTAGPVADRSRIAVAVIHSHLPKLADAGLIEWDRDQQIVEPTASLMSLGPLLDMAGLL